MNPAGSTTEISGVVWPACQIPIQLRTVTVTVTVTRFESVPEEGEVGEIETLGVIETDGVIDGDVNEGEMVGVAAF